MDQVQKAQAFAALHKAGAPLVLYNIWDAGSAKAVADTGVPAIATGSWSAAAAQGFNDGEDMPLGDVLRVASQIVEAVPVPVSVDFEGGYGADPDTVANNVAQLIDTGVIGINFEDRIVQGTGLYEVTNQAGRIAAIREMADAKGVRLFINARTDVFFLGSKDAPEEILAQVMTRAEAYRNAGADGLFVPGLNDLSLIAKLCAGQTLPVNVMRMGDGASIDVLAKAGVARISHGPAPYLAAMKAIGTAASAVL